MKQFFQQTMLDELSRRERQIMTALAGNNLRRLFDTDLRDSRAPALARGDRVSLPVTIASVRTPQLAEGRKATLGVSDAGTARTPAWLSVLRGRDDRATPVLVRISGGGRMDVVSLSSVRFARAALPNPPRPGVEMEGDAGWKWTISAMAVMDGRVYVAGMTNEEFSSTIRQIPIPFTGNLVSTGIRIYHAHHLRYETESPITALAQYTFFGSHFLVAAYSCTPLVLLPVDSLQDGAKVTGRTAERHRAA